MRQEIRRLRTAVGFAALETLNSIVRSNLINRINSISVARIVTGSNSISRQKVLGLTQLVTDREDSAHAPRSQ